MSNVARRRTALGLVVAVLCGVLLSRLVDRDRNSGASEAGKGAGDARLVESSESFTIDGNAAELISPGVMVPLDLQLTNAHDFPLSVTDLTVTVAKVRAPHADDVHPCAVGDFAVDQAARDLEVTLATRSTSTLSNLGISRRQRPHVGMLNRPVDQDGCKGASLTLAFTASGTRAS